MVTAFAEELPVERATENSATVSDEVDTADNSDPHMGTTYYMYLAPDIVATNPPDMGVSGPSTDALILLAVAVGCAYLCVSAYAHEMCIRDRLYHQQRLQVCHLEPALHFRYHDPQRRTESPRVYAGGPGSHGIWCDPCEC